MPSTCVRLLVKVPDLVQHYYQANNLRSGSYFAGSVADAPLSIAKQNIEHRTAQSMALLNPWRTSQRKPSPPT